MDSGLDGGGPAVRQPEAVPSASPSKSWKIPSAFWWWVFPLGFLLVFFFQPLAATFQAAASGVTHASIHWEYIPRPLGFTFWQAFLSTMLTLLVGLPSAYVFSHFRFPGKSFLRILTTLPFILPTVVVAAGFNTLIGANGWLNLLAMRLFSLSSPPIQILNSLGAILLAHVFYNTTIVIRVVGSAWGQMNPNLEQAARTLGASPLRAWWKVTFPLLRPSILSAALLVFLFDFTSFGVILLLGGPAYSTLEVEIYTQAMQMLNLPMAGLLSLIQLVCTLLLTIGYSRLGGQTTHQLSPRLREENLKTPRTLRQKLLVAFLVGFLFILLVTPLLSLGLRSVTRLEANRGQRQTVQTGLTLDYYRELFINRRGSLFYVPPIEAARNSLIYAGVTVVVSLTLGFCAAYALTRRSRFNNWMDPLLMLPLGTSAVTLGLGFVLVFNRPPLDIRTFPLLIPIAHSLVAFPFVVRTLQPALASIPNSLRQAAAALGATPWQVWREVELPIISRAALVSAVFSFTISLGEFGATSFLARPEYPTLPVAIYRFLSQPGALNYGQALAISTLLMIICGAAIFFIEKFEITERPL